MIRRKISIWNEMKMIKDVVRTTARAPMKTQAAPCGFALGKLGGVRLDVGEQ